MANWDLQPLMRLHLGQRLRQCRIAPLDLGPAEPRAFLAAYAADFDVDPYYEMFFFPTDTLKLIAFDHSGQVLWRRDLGCGVVPGMWFCPVLPFDLDGDGVDEIYFVNNTDSRRPFAHTAYRLERINARTGGTTGQWPWPTHGRWQSLSHAFRNFIIGGHAGGQPVLVTAQGTYGDMHLQAWRQDLTPIWNHNIAEADAGARGSHMCPVVDLDADGSDELLWGERCIQFQDGRERFCADRDTYRGHSDVIAPLLDRTTGRWFIYTIREGDLHVSPRVALFDGDGRRVWGEVEHGHMDMGWVAYLRDPEKAIAMAIRIDQKTCGPDGRFHQGRQEFTFDALTGQRVELPFSVYQTIPVDLNGDGKHELVRGLPGGDGAIITGAGEIVGRTYGTTALAQKLVDHPGEQVLAYAESGEITLWADRNARDTDLALQRYAHPFYRINRRLGISGSNLSVLGGI